MPARNENLHVVWDGRYWAIAVEGIGRIECGLEFTKAIAIATSLAFERGILLYVHDKQGWISKQVDFGVPHPIKSSQAEESNADDLHSVHARTAENAHE